MDYRRRGRNDESTKTRIETFHFADKPNCAKRRNDESTKTRIETLDPDPDHTKVIVVMTNPLKQGLKLNLKLLMLQRLQKS